MFESAPASGFACAAFMFSSVPSTSDAPNPAQAESLEDAEADLGEDESSDPWYPRHMRVNLRKLKVSA